MKDSPMSKSIQTNKESVEAAGIAEEDAFIAVAIRRIVAKMTEIPPKQLLAGAAGIDYNIKPIHVNQQLFLFSFITMTNDDDIFDRVADRAIEGFFRGFNFRQIFLHGACAVALFFMGLGTCSISMAGNIGSRILAATTAGLIFSLILLLISFCFSIFARVSGNNTAASRSLAGEIRGTYFVVVYALCTCLLLLMNLTSIMRLDGVSLTSMGILFLSGFSLFFLAFLFAYLINKIRLISQLKKIVAENNFQNVEKRK